MKPKHVYHDKPEFSARTEPITVGQYETPERIDEFVASPPFRIISRHSINPDGQQVHEYFPDAEADPADQAAAQPKEPAQAAGDPIEDCLERQSLKLYLFLKDRKHWTKYDTLAERPELWRRSDPPDETIQRALRRLRDDLNALSDCGITLKIEHKGRRTVLDK